MTGDMIEYNKSRKMSSRKSKRGGSGSVPIQKLRDKTYEDYKKNLNELLEELETFKNTTLTANGNCTLVIEITETPKKDNKITETKTTKYTLNQWLDDTILSIKSSKYLNLTELPPFAKHVTNKTNASENLGLKQKHVEKLMSIAQKARDKVEIADYTRTSINKISNILKYFQESLSGEEKIHITQADQIKFENTDDYGKNAKFLINTEINALITKIQNIDTSYKNGGFGAEVFVFVVLVFGAVSLLGLGDEYMQSYYGRKGTLIKIYEKIYGKTSNVIEELMEKYKQKIIDRKKKDIEKKLTNINKELEDPNLKILQAFDFFKDLLSKNKDFTHIRLDYLKQIYKQSYVEHRILNILKTSPSYHAHYLKNLEETKKQAENYNLNFSGPSQNKKDEILAIIESIPTGPDLDKINYLITNFINEEQEKTVTSVTVNYLFEHVASEKMSREIGYQLMKDIEPQVQQNASHKKIYSDFMKVQEEIFNLFQGYELPPEDMTVKIKNIFKKLFDYSIEIEMDEINQTRKQTLFQDISKSIFYRSVLFEHPGINEYSIGNPLPPKGGKRTKKIKAETSKKDSSKESKVKRRPTSGNSKKDESQLKKKEKKDKKKM